MFARQGQTHILHSRCSWLFRDMNVAWKVFYKKYILFPDRWRVCSKRTSSIAINAWCVQYEVWKAMQMKMELLHICINPWRVRRELFSAGVVLTGCAQTWELGFKSRFVSPYLTKR